MHSFIEWLLTFFGALSYRDIFCLMTLESSIFPVPSELVMIPAGILAFEGKIDPVLASLVGGIGSVVGALLNYWILGRFLGKPLIEKYGKYILITPEKYKKAEDLFLRNDKLSTFLGRFIPVIRHIISIPAGVFRMGIPAFVLLTGLGATLWCAILVSLGYFFGDSVISITKEYIHEITLVVVPLSVFYIWWKIFRKGK